MSGIRVFIADDQELIRYALRTLLEAEPDFEVVGEADVSDSAVSGCVTAKPDILLLELRLPGVGGVEVCREVRARCPGITVLVLASAEEDEEMFAVLSAGACGYLLKDTSAERVVEATRLVAGGQSVFDASIAEKIIARGSGTAAVHGSDPLSERETEVLQHMAQGLSNREIGRALWIGETTVKTHVSHILHKLGAADRTQAVLAAVKTGLVRLGR
jgi:DNA-binding NarL/FixJ family response regulator